MHSGTGQPLAAASHFSAVQRKPPLVNCQPPAVKLNHHHLFDCPLVFVHGALAGPKAGTTKAQGAAQGRGLKRLHPLDFQSFEPAGEGWDLGYMGLVAPMHLFLNEC